MTIKKSKLAFGLGLLFVVIAGISLLLAISLPWWTIKEYDFFGAHWKENLGLWKICQKSNDPVHGIEKTCMTHTEPEEYIVSTRSLLTFGVFLLGAGTVAVCVQKWCLKEMVLLGFLGAIVVSISGLLTWIATVQFTKAYVDVPGNHPDDLYVCWLVTLSSSALSFVSGILFSSRKICAAI